MLTGTESRLLCYYWIRRTLNANNNIIIESIQLFGDKKYPTNLPYCQIGDFTLITPFRVLKNLRLLKRLSVLAENPRYELHSAPYKKNIYLFTLVDLETHKTFCYKIKLFSLSIVSPLVYWVMYLNLPAQDKLRYKINLLSEKERKLKAELSSMVRTNLENDDDLKDAIKDFKKKNKVKPEKVKNTLENVFAEIGLSIKSWRGGK